MIRIARIVYVTANKHKAKEVEHVCQGARLDGVLVRDLFSFDIRPVHFKELLEVDLALKTREEVIQAYSYVKEPCIVEHAGLVFDGYESYPGGLTKPLWNVLGERFLDELNAKGRPAIARAVVAYCDGKRILTFVGETAGRLAEDCRGASDFYWDSVFVPECADPLVSGKTYGEIRSDPALGLAYKVLHLSQSTKALLEFLKYRRVNTPALWPRS